ncbi:MAG: hypothetical protein ACK4GG_09375 [Sphingomonas sp.]
MMSSFGPNDINSSIQPKDGTMRGGYGLVAAMIAIGVGSSPAHTSLEPAPLSVIE